MTLGEKQELFMRLLPRLIDKAHELGFDLRGGDLFRDSRLHGQNGEVFESEGPFTTYASANSNHKLKCAIDLNLFRDGAYLTTTADHMELGMAWEEMNPHCRWGGHFDDANHYEIIDT
ncbi:unnamed protein product [marine sediment metagenome]|uniref:Peptidase M15C domain-containing protein n=1 Tax=marine sediment metagenome TaxID=412755 RepID=X0RWY7_9ZZZZ